MKNLIPREISAILPEVYAVGGCVRDMLLGRKPKDVDLCTPATPEEVTRLFTSAGYRVIPTGEKHGTVTVLVNGEPYEITTFRTDVETDGRHAVIEYTRDIREDLARRDLTINAMAIDGSGRIVDPFGGRDDLERRTVRSVGDPYERFSEDLLRIIRAARFASTLGFKIEPETAEAMSAMAPILRDRIGKQDQVEHRLPNGGSKPLVGVSVERLKEEFDKAFAGSEKPSRFLSEMWDLGVFQTLVPEMADADDLMQDPRYHPEGSVWQHTLEVVDRSRPEIRWNALLHDLGKCMTAEDTGEGFSRFHGHEGMGADAIEGIGRRLKMSNEEIASIEATTRLHMQPMNLQNSGVTERAIRRFQHSAGPHLENLQGLVSADAGWRYNPSWDPLFVPVQSDQIQPALMGRHLIERGFKPGPEMGEVLKRAFEHQLDTGETNIDRLVDVATGGKPTVATIASGMVRMASEMDRRGLHDLADAMDRVAQRQMMLPLVIDPTASYTGRATEVIPPDEMPEGVEDDQGIYHVTTNYPSVLERGLMSRDQLQSVGIQGQGLGGSIPYESGGMVATTYSPTRASEIEADLQELAGWIKGEVPSSRMLQRLYDAAGEALMSWDEGGSWDVFAAGMASTAASYGIPVKGLARRLKEGDESAIAELGERIDSAGLDPEDRYSMLQSMESSLYGHLEDEYFGADERPPDPTSGLAAPFEAVREMDPRNVRTIPLRVREGADVEHWPQEEQLNVHPWDLELDVPELLPHERRTIQETMRPPRWA